MEPIPFALAIDLPLTIVTVIGFLLNFHFWAKADGDGSQEELKGLLPRANVRLILFFVSILTVCWFANLAVWSIFAILILVGLIISMFSGESLGPNMMTVLTAGILREWCFGFPTLILNPPTQSSAPSQNTPEHEMVGLHGITSSPLRPSGDIQIDGKDVPAISDDGTLIDNGTDVVVTGMKNGRARVRILNSDTPFEH